MLAADALRSLIDAILVHPGERRGEVSLSLRGDLAAFLEMAEVGAAGRDRLALNGNTSVIARDNRGLREIMGSLDAGTGFGLWRTVLGNRALA